MRLIRRLERSRHEAQGGVLQHVPAVQGDGKELDPYSSSQLNGLGSEALERAAAQ